MKMSDMKTTNPRMRLVSPETVPACAAEEGWAALVRRARAGDTGAFEQLASTHYRSLLSFARGLSGSEAEAADVAQEALLKAFKRMGSYRFEAPFRAWLFQIARRAFLDRARQRVAWTRQERQYEEAHGGRCPESPEEALRARQDARGLRRALDRVDPDFREVVVLFDLEGLSYREIADICEVPLGTVKSRLCRGREALRQELLPQRQEGHR
jgi:RNA polymerase sigma-70 factor (ECF subfamily)